MNEESSEQTGPERDPTDPGTPGSGAEDVPGSGSAGSGAEDVRGSGSPTGEAEGVPQTEEEVRARIEEQIRKLRVQDLMVESVVSVLNLTARRIAKEDERDLDQARIGIDAVKAWVDLLPDEAATQIRNALSELQMLYAAAVEGGGGKAGAEGEQTQADSGTPPRTGASSGHRSPSAPSEDAPRTGSDPPPRIWTPPGSK